MVYLLQQLPDHHVDVGQGAWVNVGQSVGDPVPVHGLVAGN